jgi:hypothetical protein
LAETLDEGGHNLRRETQLSEPTQAASYGAGTRVGVHRSRFELERVLDRYGATDFAFVEAGTSAAIQFAMDGRYVELGLPLPDPNEPHFTHTASGRPRAVSAQERAYEQALREHWRGLLLAVRGKLQSVESGLSTFDDEFRNFLAPHLDEKQTKRERSKPRAVNWLLGGSHSLAIALVAAFLVPASAVGAFALPPTVVGRLAAPFRGVLPKELGVPSDDGRALALGQSIWAHDETAPTQAARPVRVARRGFAATQPQTDPSALDSSADQLAASEVGLRSSNEPPPAPPAAPPAIDKPAPQASAPEPPAAPAETTTPSNPVPPAEDGAPADDPVDPPAGTEGSGSSESSEPTAPVGEPASDDTQSATEPPPAGEPESQDDGTPPADPPAPPAPPADPGKDKGDDHDNGNHNGADNGNKNGAGNGNGNGKGKGK